MSRPGAKPASKRSERPAEDAGVDKCFVAVPCKESEAQRLRAAGFFPVVRWVEDVRSVFTLKTVEALTLLDRREAKERRKP